MRSYDLYSEKIVEICKRVHARGMTAAGDGNVSFRVSNNEILITPSGVNKAYIQAGDVAGVTIDDKILSGNPSSERLMHLEVFKLCPKARAVVHAHPPHAIAWSVAFPKMKELPFESLSEVILAVGRIPIVSYAQPSTLEMGTHLSPYLPHHRVMILARHGALSWGEDLEEAYNGMERLEHTAQILFLARQMGPLTKLSKKEIKALEAMRSRLGERSL